ncbi:MAG TPA: 6-phosphogluconolactonase [Thermoanaerobaculia bacterium]|jgi:6-phosphogluconolactonase|nr:6-phosphogluconolactonase [Thermoanaerobaculia bacterium]
MEELTRVTEHGATRVMIANDRAELAQTAAEQLARGAARAVALRGKFTLALAGGSTPRDLYQRLAEEPLLSAMPWANVHLFWGDERAVPPDHEESNYRMVREALLEAPVPPPLPAGNIHRIPTELPDSVEAAARYEADLRGFFALKDGETPRFDLVLLGLGADGHTASLFPGTGAVAICDRLCFSLWVERLATHRLTLSLPVFLAARSVAFLAAGLDKAEKVQAVLGEDAPHRSADELPAAAVRPTHGELTWWLDRDAASRLAR